MKLKDFLENPAGKGDSSTNRAILRSILDSKYDNLVKNKHISHKIYKVLNKQEYYVHLIIPSETERTNTYDVVLKFTDSGDTNSDLTILNYDVTFFCNAPSFAYTFGYVFYKDGLLINELWDKLGKTIINNAPSTRNRYGIVNYDKYLYFGAKYVYESRLLIKSTLRLRSINYSKIVFHGSIRNLDTIMSEYQKAKNKLRAGKGKPITPSSHEVKSRDNGNVNKIIPKVTHNKKKNIIKKHAKK